MILSLDEMKHIVHNLKVFKDFPPFENQRVKLVGTRKSGCIILTRHKNDGVNKVAIPNIVIERLRECIKAMLDYIDFYNYYGEEGADMMHMFNACAGYVNSMRSEKENVPLREDKKWLTEIFDLQSMLFEYIGYSPNEEEAENWEKMASNLTPNFSSDLEKIETPPIEYKIWNCIHRLIKRNITPPTKNDTDK